MSIPFITKRKWVSSGISVCRLKNGQIDISMHEGEKRIVLEVTEQEARLFVEELVSFFFPAKQPADSHARTARGERRPDEREASGGEAG